ncbi:hypothetical protein N0V87_010338 [Didymella glomerata]|uniref:Uncharacterized protein n=1 Tax=Didymella glomerata TaxID=749621 RepID=A0A9W8WQ33_9PLEO|nr:hypothetical protein N0V87_010338 [Didymella glomerata]
MGSGSSKESADLIEANKQALREKRKSFNGAGIGGGPGGPGGGSGGGILGEDFGAGGDESFLRKSKNNVQREEK